MSSMRFKPTIIPDPMTTKCAVCHESIPDSDPRPIRCSKCGRKVCFRCLSKAPSLLNAKPICKNCAVAAQ